MRLFSEGTPYLFIAADSSPPYWALCPSKSVSACSDERSDTLILSGSMSLVYGQATAQRFECCLTGSQRGSLLDSRPDWGRYTE